MKNIKMIGHRVVYFYFKLFDLHVYADVNYDVKLGTNYKTMMKLRENVNIKFNNQPIASLMLAYENNVL